MAHSLNNFGQFNTGIAIKSLGWILEIKEEFFTIAKRWKETMYLSMHKWKKKTWYIHTTGYYSALKSKKNPTNRILRT